MDKSNIIEYSVFGRYALFTDPLSKIGGEKCTYQIPTYQALKGITESIYWKPTIVWIIDECRIMNAIQTESKGIRPIKYSGGNDLSYYTYLKDCRYQVKAHFIWNENRPELENELMVKYYDSRLDQTILLTSEEKQYIAAKETLIVGYFPDCYPFSYENEGEYLGLARQILEEQKGSIMVKNNYPAGSRFQILLPM